MEIIKAKEVVYKYTVYNESGNMEETALDGISLDIDQGGFTAVLGHNGSGKSTLAKHFNALLLPASGTVVVDGIDTKEGPIWQVRQNCGMVFQNPDNQIVATMVEEDVAFGLENLGIPQPEIVQRVESALTSVNMLHARSEMPTNLSGGQKQRIAIAGIIAMKPKVIIFDEPTAMLDPTGRKDVMSAIKQLVSEGISVILITHYMEEAIQADRVIVIDHGKVLMDDTPQQIFSKVDEIKKIGLDVPQVTELAYDLNQLGMAIRKDTLSIESFVEQAKKLRFNQRVTEPEADKTDEPNLTSDYVMQIEQLSHTFSVGSPFEKTAIKDITLNIKKGAFVGIIGHTGSGKSTFIQHLNSLLKPTGGRILLNGMDINAEKSKLKEVRQKVGIVFQYPEHQLFETTIYRDVAFGPKNMGMSEMEIDERVRKALELVKIPEELFEKSPFDLSGGQKRRVAIAGILAMDPEVLILDEPTAGLDPKGREEILEQIKHLHEQTNNTILFITHSMEDVAKFADELIVLDHGMVKCQGTPREVFSHVEELEAIGLAAPQISYLASELKKVGIDIGTGIYTVEAAKNAFKQRVEG